MKLGKYFAAVAAASLAVAPAMANPAASLSVAKSARAGTSAKGEQLAGGGGFIVAIIAAAAVIVGIIIVANEDDSPDSN